MRDNDPRSAEDQIIDRYLDGDLLPDESCELFDSLRSDPARSRELFAMQRAIHALGEPVHSPDFSRPILKAVGRRRGLVSAPARRLFTLGRVAAAAAVVVLIAGLYTVHRFAPGVTSPGVAIERPLADLEKGVSKDVPRAIESVQRSLAIEGNLKFASDISTDGAEILIDEPFPALSFSSSDVAPVEFSLEFDTLIARNLVATGSVVIAPDSEGLAVADSAADGTPGAVLPILEARAATSPLMGGMPGVIQRPDGTILLRGAESVFDAPVDFDQAGGDRR